MCKHYSSSKIFPVGAEDGVAHRQNIESKTTAIITTDLTLARLEEETEVPRMGRMAKGAANIAALLAKR